MRRNLIFMTYSTYRLVVCWRNRNQFLSIVTTARRNKKKELVALSPRRNDSQFSSHFLSLASTTITWEFTPLFPPGWLKSAEQASSCVRRVALLCVHRSVPKGRRVARLTLSRRLSEVTYEWEPIVARLSCETTESGSCSTWPSGLCACTHACMQHICPYFVTPLFISPFVCQQHEHGVAALCPKMGLPMPNQSV